MGAGALLVLTSSCGGARGLVSREVESPYHVVDQAARVLVTVEREYVEPVDRDRLLEGAIRGMVAELDPHSAYLAARDYGVFQSDTEGRFGGIGVEVDFRGEYVLVIAAIEGSPADRAGVRAGDRILAIGSTGVRDQTPEDLVALMRGRPGSSVTITVRREGQDRPLYFTLTREIIHVKSVASKRMLGSVGYLRIKQFQTGTHTELLQAVAAIREQGPLVGLLLDLRNNPGGLVNEAAAVADELLSGGVIYSTRHRGRIVDELRATSFGALQRGPVVVLVNEYTASAAELVAGALQDHRRATVVGARTFGKGSVQTIIDLPGGAGLKLTTMRYYTPNGRSIQAQGIEPGVAVEAGWTRGQPQEVLRESDLPNHLPAEGLVPATPPDAVRKPSEDPSGLPPTDLGVAREIPDDPTGGPDVALALGYQIITGVMSAAR